MQCDKECEKTCRYAITSLQSIVCYKSITCPILNYSMRKYRNSLQIVCFLRVMTFSHPSSHGPGLLLAALVIGYYGVLISQANTQCLIFQIYDLSTARNLSVHIFIWIICVNFPLHCSFNEIVCVMKATNIVTK
uniref:Uncharacterized protein n=1 Tax=Glossina austeni TaxID=7395 RepID=A0A1A9V7J0_GLOAU